MQSQPSGVARQCCVSQATHRCPTDRNTGLSETDARPACREILTKAKHTYDSIYRKNKFHICVSFRKTEKNQSVLLFAKFISCTAHVQLHPAGLTCCCRDCRLFRRRALSALAPLRASWLNCNCSCNTQCSVIDCIPCNPKQIMELPTQV